MREVVNEVVCVRAFCFFAMWRFSVKVFCGSPFFFYVARSHWHGVKH